MVMATSRDGPVERGVGGNVNMSLVCEEAFSILPIRQTRTEGWENRAIHRLQCLEDKGIGD